MNKETEEQTDKTTECDHTKKRENVRFELPTMVILKFFNPDGSGKTVITVNAVIKDLSLGGACIEIDERYTPIDIDQLAKQIVKMNIRFPDKAKTPYILGSVRWFKREVKKGKYILRLGIQFEEMSEDTIRAIKEFIDLGIGDQNLLWDLWETSVSLIV
ncbi:MAG: PilZ domain-containing protein [Thermodesulfobacteriota bacterium]|nr:PilZ domain-containing protein [Thermodesulfobacteriota bacterium]